MLISIKIHSKTVKMFFIHKILKYEMKRRIKTLIDEE